MKRMQLSCNEPGRVLSCRCTYSTVCQLAKNWVYVLDSTVLELYCHTWMKQRCPHWTRCIRFADSLGPDWDARVGERWAHFLAGLGVIIAKRSLSEAIRRKDHGLL